MHGVIAKSETSTHSYRSYTYPEQVDFDSGALKIFSSSPYLRIRARPCRAKCRNMQNALPYLRKPSYHRSPSRNHSSEDILNFETESETQADVGATASIAMTSELSLGAAWELDALFFEIELDVHEILDIVKFEDALQYLNTNGNINTKSFFCLRLSIFPPSFVVGFACVYTSELNQPLLNRRNLTKLAGSQLRSE